MTVQYSYYKCHPLLFSLSFSVVIWPTASLAGEGQADWASCPTDQRFAINQPMINGLPVGSVYIEADQAIFREQGESRLQGKVFIQKDQQTVQAERLQFARDTEQVTAEEQVVFNTQNMTMLSKQASFNLQDNTGKIIDVDYQIKTTVKNTSKYAQAGQGHSDTIVRYKNNTSELKKADYSTCPSDNKLWAIHAKKIKLDHNKNVGTARNVTFRVGKKQTPIFYFPYFSFPLSNERKSGFLMPNYKSGNKIGVGVSLPYYINLAPNYDVTLTPHIFSQRGILLGSEFRYLDKQHEGQLQFDVLPNDNKKEDDHRYYFNVQHRATLLDNRIGLDIQAEGVSDNDYFNDFGGTLAASSTTTLRREATVNSAGQDWTFLGRIQSFQLLDGTSNPYERLPQLLFSYKPINLKRGLDFRFDSEVVRFVNKKEAPNATRFDLKTTLEKNFTAASHYIKPSVGLRHTQYFIDNNPQGDNTISRTLPTVSVDAGLFFDRSFDKNSKIQTLEPRLYYVRTPYKDQNDIPNFDSSLRTFNYGSLFLDNRFNGRDRVEDANRVSMSLTSRVLDKETGKEWLRASVGQIVNFEDRKVTLPDDNIDTASRSQIAFEASGKVAKRVGVRSQALWDAETGDFDSGEIQFNYKDDKKRILNLGYRQLQDELEQAHVSTVAPINDRWKMIANWDYDLKNERNLETMVGVEYGTCCLKTRVVGRNYLTSDNNTHDNALFVEFAFKGLGSVGTNTKELLDGRIDGYE